MRLSLQQNDTINPACASREISVTLFEFEHQVKRYKDRVYGFAFHYLGTAEEAEDVTQEVFIRFWQHRMSLDAKQPIGWLLRVTRNVSIDAIRRRKTYRKNVSVDSEMVENVSEVNLSPEQHTEYSDFQMHLKRALDKLAEPYRSIVIMREIEEMKYNEIGEALELPLNTVKVYLHRARKMLRDQLKEVFHREHG